MFSHYAVHCLEQNFKYLGLSMGLLPVQGTSIQQRFLQQITVLSQVHEINVVPKESSFFSFVSFWEHEMSLRVFRAILLPFKSQLGAVKARM